MNVYVVNIADEKLDRLTDIKIGAEITRRLFIVDAGQMLKIKDRLTHIIDQKKTAYSFTYLATPTKAK
ncbi:MAG: hypothetical protein LBS84_02825 [Clostridiales bacterium]|jgi:hypothetical protein|nr:hypothetical protein [Clostridiales bacterium]